MGKDIICAHERILPVSPESVLVQHPKDTLFFQFMAKHKF